MRSYRHTAYALRAQDIAAMDLAAERAALDARGQGGFIIDLPPFVFDDERAAARACHECGIGHVGACDSHAVQVALILAGVAR